eukprot:8538268-Pyramimonas_sp.AAC.1
MSARHPGKVLVAWRKGLRLRCPPRLAIYVRHLFAYTSFCERWETTQTAVALWPPQGMSAGRYFAGIVCP